MSKQKNELQVPEPAVSNHEVAKQKTGMSRNDFLKLAGAGGLGMAAMGMTGPAMAGEGKKGKFLFVISAGSNDPNRAMLALLLADVVQKQELGDVHIYLWGEAAELCKVGSPDKIVSSNFFRLGDALGMLERLARNGAQIGVCPPCADWHSAVDDQLYDWCKREDGGVLMRSMMESWTAWL